MSGPDVRMRDTDDQTLSLGNLRAGDYVIELRVYDEKGQMGQDRVAIKVLPGNFRNFQLFYLFSPIDDLIIYLCYEVDANVKKTLVMIH